ncbi:MAG: DUF421 domain-containing protein [Lysinibacillus sp.]
MDDYLIILFRTCFLYLLILVVFRLMGKREVGELSIMDLAVFVLIAEVAAFALELENELFKSIMPILILLVIQILSAFISMKSKKIRDIIDGDPTLIVRDGVILESEMRKQRYNLDDLFQQLRENGVASVADVSFAYLEASGKLSVYKRDEKSFVYPLIVDGDIQERHLELIHKDVDWLFEELAKQKMDDHTIIFYCALEENGLHVQLKEN